MEKTCLRSLGSEEFILRMVHFSGGEVGGSWWRSDHDDYSCRDLDEGGEAGSRRAGTTEEGDGPVTKMAKDWHCCWTGGRFQSSQEQNSHKVFNSLGALALVR